MTKIKAVAVSVIAFIILVSSGCSTVNSSELKTTKAEDLKIDATLYEYNETNSVSVGAQMLTILSNVGIEFDQGEMLTAQWDEGSGISSKVTLSNTKFLNLDKDYEGTITKTVSEGNYYITYKDSEGVETTAQFATGIVSDLTSPAEGETLSGNTTAVTWDPATMQAANPLTIKLSWNSIYAYSIRYFREIPNTGSYELDISESSGPGSVELINMTGYYEMEGFGETSIRMNNVSIRNVTFNNAAVDPFASAKSATSLADPADMTKEEIVEAQLHQCLRHCDENEEYYFFVEDEKYSCCLE